MEYSFVPLDAPKIERTEPGAEAQSRIDFASRRAGVNGGFEPARWQRWLHWRLDGLPEERRSGRILDAAHAIGPAGTRTLTDLFPRAVHRQATKAYLIGRAIRQVEAEEGMPPSHRSSGMESLAMGGFFGDLIATVSLVLDGPDLAPYDDVLSVVDPGQWRTIAVPGLHGSIVINPDYDRVLDEQTVLTVLDTAPFDTAFDRWISSRRRLRLHWAFEAARSRIADQDVFHGLEILQNGVKMRAHEKASIANLPRELAERLSGELYLPAQYRPKDDPEADAMIFRFVRMTFKPRRRPRR